MMIALTKQCRADDVACNVAGVQQVCANVLAELQGPFNKVGVSLAATGGTFDSNTLVFGGLGLTCGFDVNGMLAAGFTIRGGGASPDGTCDLHCLNVAGARVATIVPAGSGIINAAVDWLGTTNLGSKYTGYTYYHDWLATVGLHTFDGSAAKKLIVIAPDLERFFGEVMISMQPTT